MKCMQNPTCGVRNVITPYKVADLTHAKSGLCLHSATNPYKVADLTHAKSDL